MVVSPKLDSYLEATRGRPAPSCYAVPEFRSLAIAVISRAGASGLSILGDAASGVEWMSEVGGGRSVDDQLRQLKFVETHARILGKMVD